jgi:RND family efflux transporter MFP subunit
MNDRLSSDLASLKISRDEAPPPTPWLKWIAFLVVPAALAGAIWIWAVPSIEATVFKVEVETTTIVTVSPSESQVNLTSTGYVVPQRVSKVGAKIPGRISVMNVAEGEQVKAGAVLAELEAADFEANIRTANARVLAAKAQVQTQLANLADAQQKADREQALAESGVATREAAQNLKARAVTLQKQVEAARANVKAAQAEAEGLGVNLSYLTIKAPMDGTVVNKPAGVGGLVGQHVGALVELADFSSLMMESDVAEGRLHLVELGAPCEIVLDAFPKKRHRGRVAEISPKVNRAKATVTVKIEFVDPTERVLPDMAGRVSFLKEELDVEAMKAPAKVVIPAVALADRGGAKVVFVIEEGAARMRSVTLGEAVGTGFELLDGPPVGAKIVREPAETLTDGQKIKEKEA